MNNAHIHVELRDRTMSSRIERFQKIAMNYRVKPESITGLSPDEELDQLRSLLNPLVLKTCHESLLPHWMKSEATTGLITNDKHRNWAVVGGVGGKAYGILDSVGSVWALRECGSLDIFTMHNGSVVRPGKSDSPELHLVSPEDQVYEWSVTLGPIEFTRLIYYVNDGANEAIYNEIRVRNLSLEKKQFDFLIALKPFSPLGFEPIESIEFDPENNALYSNGYLALMMNEAPSSSTISTCTDPNLLKKGVNGDTENKSYTSVKGLTTALLKFSINLRPAGTESFFFISPLSYIKRGEQIPEFVMGSSAIEKAVDDWFSFTGRKMIGIYPDMMVGNSLAQAKATLVIMYYDELINRPLIDDIQRSIEVARIIMAMTLSGCAGVIMDSYADLLQSLEKGIKQGYDSLFPVAWALFYNLLHVNTETINEPINQLIESILPLLLSTSFNYAFGPQQAAQVESGGSSSANDLSEGPSSSDPDLIADEPDEKHAIQERISSVLGSVTWSKLAQSDADYESSSEMYFTRTMHEMWAHSLLRISHKFLPPAIQSIANDLIPRLHEIVQKHLGNLMTLNLTPSQSMSVLTSLISVETPGLQSRAFSDFVKKQVRAHIKRGLFDPCGTKICLSSHLALRLAEYYAMMKQRHDADELLLKSLQYTSSFYTLPDFVNPETHGGCAGYGCSIQAAADIILLVRRMILYYAAKDLILLPGIPEEWFTATSPLVIRQIPTLFGPIDIEIASSKNQYQIELNMPNPPAEIELHTPMSFSISLVKAYGGSIIERSPNSDSPFVRAVPLSERVIFTFHR